MPPDWDRAVSASTRAGLIVALVPAALWAVFAAGSIPHLATIGASLSVVAGAPLWIFAGWLVGRLWASELVVPGRILSAARIGLVAMTATVLGATVVALSLGVGPVLEAVVEGRASVTGSMASLATYWLVGVIVVGPFSLLLTVPMACAWLALARRLAGDQPSNHPGRAPRPAVAPRPPLPEDAAMTNPSAPGVVATSRFTIHEAPPDDPRGHVCEPRITRLADGTILLAFRTGTGRQTPDGSPRLLRSTDEGRTWEDLGTPFLGAPEAAHGDLRGCAMTQFPSGDVLTCIVWLDRTDPDRPIYHPDTEGLTPVRNLLAVSRDSGATWTPLGDLDSGISQAASQGLLTLPDGDVLATFETFKAYDEPGRWVYRGGLIRSRDRGRTWVEPVISAVMSDGGTMWWDPRIARLPDGTLVQLYYAYEHDRGGEAPVHAGWSTDEGRTWTEPAPTSLVGQASYPIAFPGGELLAFTQVRDDPGRMVVALSGDAGRTWSAQQDLYRHGAVSAPAAAPGQAAIDYLVSMERFTFGHPCGVALDERRALLVWYAGGETRTAIEGAIVELVVE